MNIKEANIDDLSTVLEVERVAFGEDDEAELVEGLMDDATAKPLLSLLATENGKGIGHVLFTKARLLNASRDVNIALLAPLAVVPTHQRQGVGKALTQKGLEILKKKGVELVFVLGHPSYYPRCGFEPAGRLGFDAPYPIPEEVAGAWMVQALVPGIVGTVSGQVMCSDFLYQPQYWRE